MRQNKPIYIFPVPSLELARLIFFGMSERYTEADLLELHRNGCVSVLHSQYSRLQLTLTRLEMVEAMKRDVAQDETQDFLDVRADQVA